MEEGDEGEGRNVSEGFRLKNLVITHFLSTKNYYAFTPILLIKIVLCSKFP